ncbi:MAG: hypothetical protein H3C27_17095 [Opitutaceae bacterium]|nr:hypothetical protein [Opitutaceae bacterium]
MMMLVRSLIVGLLAGVSLAVGSPPEANAAQPRPVELGVYILNITELDEPAERLSVHLMLGAYWQDPALAFAGDEPRLWRETEALDQANSIWNPMVEFNRTLQSPDMEHALLRIHPDGRVDFERQMNVHLSTELDLRELPFDTQHVQIELESFQHQAHEMTLTLAPADLRITPQISLPQWRVGRLTAKTASYFNELYDETYSRTTVTVELQRRHQFYIWQMMVPLVILIGVAFAVFFLPLQDLADRMNVIVASLLTIVALSYTLHAELPKIPYLTVIDWLFILAYIFLGLAMAAMVWIRRLADRDLTRAQQLDRIIRWACPIAYFLAATFCVGRALL